jgi:hypothetical protein
MFTESYAILATFLTLMLLARLVLWLIERYLRSRAKRDRMG